MSFVVGTTTVAPQMAPVAKGTNFRDSIRVIAPPWLSGFWGQRFLYMLGLQIDVISEALRMGVIQRMPLSCEEEALPFIGGDRQMPRGPSEPTDGYRERLRLAFPTWKLAGNAPTLLRQLAAYYAPDPPQIRYVCTGVDDQDNLVTDWWTSAAHTGELSYHRSSPGNWDWDGQTDQIRFWVIFYLPPLTPWYVGDGHVVGGGQSVGFTESNTFITDIRAIIGKWKAAGSHAGTYPNLQAGIILTESTMLAPIQVGTFTVGDGSLIGMTTEVEAFNPLLAPGAPMPDGDWDIPANRFANAFYCSGI